MPVQPLYTFSQAEQELQYRLGNRTDLGTGTADRLAQWLNVAQISIASVAMAAEDLDQIAWPLITVDGQSEYSLIQVLPPATNVVGLRAVRNNTQRVLMQRFAWTEYRQLNQQVSGNPLRWARLGYTLAFDPQPDATTNEIIIDYRREPQLGVSELPNRFQNDWITLAEWIGWKALLKPDRAQAAYALLPKLLQNTIDQPMDWDQWDSKWDISQQIAPTGFSYPFMVSP